VQAATEAARDRRRVRFGYRTSQGKASDREVDAFAVVFRGGHWYVVGHDHEREDLRAFRLSRVTTDLVDVGEGSEPPTGFRAATHVAAGPWAVDAEERATVAFAPKIAWWAAGTLAGAREGATREDGWVEVTVAYADEEALASIVLQFGEDAVVDRPESLRNAVINRLEAASV
jgi:predicted DNA-binding transcriptional regulator YafY